MPSIALVRTESHAVLPLRHDISPVAVPVGDILANGRLINELRARTGCPELKRLDQPNRPPIFAFEQYFLKKPEICRRR